MEWKSRRGRVQFNNTSPAPSCQSLWHHPLQLQHKPRPLLSITLTSAPAATQAPPPPVNHSDIIRSSYNTSPASSCQSLWHHPLQLQHKPRPLLSITLTSSAPATTQAPPTPVNHSDIIRSSYNTSPAPSCQSLWHHPLQLQHKPRPLLSITLTSSAPAATQACFCSERERERERAVKRASYLLLSVWRSQIWCCVIVRKCLICVLLVLPQQYFSIHCMCCFYIRLMFMITVCL